MKQTGTNGHTTQTTPSIMDHDESTCTVHLRNEQHLHIPTVLYNAR